MSMWKNLTTAFTKQEAGGGVFEYLQSSMDLTRIAPDMMGSVLKHRDDLMSLDAFRKTQAAARKLIYNDSTDTIRQLSCIGEFQHANSLLQPYLVAMPEYRTLYNQNMAAGYENGYSTLDRFRGTAYMHTDDNFREATSDMSTEYDEDRIWHWASNEDRQQRLSFISKCEIQINWTRMRDFDWEDSDPCSEFNASC